MTTFAAVELGGTKTLVAVGEGPGDVGEPHRIETDDPGSTLGRVIDYLAPHQPQAIGVGSFGPLELRPGRADHGHVTNTPKPGWSHFDLLGAFESLGAPVELDTDVNAAALGEWTWGAAAGLGTVLYVTVGTGVGAGVLVGGMPLHGAPHPEGGHVVVERHPDDPHPGSCPYHGNCLEGMAAGPALADRFGRPAEALEGELLAEARRLVVHYLAQGLRSLIYAVAPERVVLGGGVSKLPGLHEEIREELRRVLAGYPGVSEHASADFVVPPGLGDGSGLAGALALARRSVS